jgi:hypothetical protein
MNKFGVGEADAVAGGGAEGGGVVGAGLFHASSGPLTRLLSPWISRFPAKATKGTSRVSPGSKRTAVPAGMSRRNPRAARGRRRARVGFREMEMAADLDRAVAGVGDG